MRRTVGARLRSGLCTAFGVGLFYDEGYFSQHTDANGWQQESWTDIDPERLPMALVTGEDGRPVTVTVPIRRGEVDAFVVGGEAVVMLSDAQRTYQVLAERMRQGVAAVSADGQICYVNERFAAMMAMRGAKLLGIPLLDLVAAPDRPKLEQLLKAPSRNAHCEVRLRCGNGERMLVGASAAVVADGQTVCLFSDLTEQKRHEASDERTRRFLAMLAHEFANMLAPIGQSAELLQRADGLDENARGALETIESQLARLKGLVEDLRRVNPPE